MVESDFRIRRKKGSGTASRFWIKLQLRVTVLYCSCPPSKWRENEMKPAGIHNTIKRFAFTPLHTRIIVIQDALSYFVYWVWTSQESCSGLLKLFLMLREKITFLMADMMDAGAFAYWYAILRIPKQSMAVIILIKFIRLVQWRESINEFW